ncbi:peptidase C39 bacteriocin processing [Deinococcus sp. SDU3-2]|uniref:Peptidase C39 bacteriocin processing n=1 Tax=Deinococcus terrestris TaxID=2651870 RepID=A0A7X1NY26_9DEIO|nr:cysteine peptidase family C39 domain-containing protein [Deinococcus terrestris]MPY67921.1 peptidase C39 bacteriocin processing [Deinococcus terrestris]
MRLDHRLRSLRIATGVSVLLLAFGTSATAQGQDYRTLRYQSVIGQTSDFTCGPAALATLLTHYYGRPVSEKTLTERSVADMQARGKEVVEGITLLSLRNALTTENVPSAGYKLTLEQLRGVMEAGLPVVANVVYPKGHYYLVLAVDDQNVLLADPSWGVRSQPIANFLNAWNGVVLMPQPSEAEAAQARAQVRQQLSKYRERIERLKTGA